MPTTLLTGMHRAGTTLTCVLLDELPDVIALVEPMTPPLHGDADRAVEEIVQFVAGARERALRDGLALSKARDGSLTDNLISPPNATDELRQPAANRELLPIGKELSPDFHLFVKHPALFSALAERLAQRFTVFAIVRNPLAVLASWQTIAFPAHDGHLPAAERFAPELVERLARYPDRLTRQVEVLSWLLSVYARLGRDRVVRYEDLIGDPVATLRRLHGKASIAGRVLREVKVEERYPTVDLARLAAALRRITADVEPLYPDFSRTLERYASGA